MGTKKAWCNLGAILLLILFCIYLLPSLLSLFMPFITGWFLTLFMEPGVKFLEKKLKINRKAGAVIILLLVLVGILLLFGFLLEWLLEEAGELFRLLPQSWETAQEELGIITAKWESVTEYLPKDMVGEIEAAGSTLQKEVGSFVGKLSVPTAGAVGNFAQKLPGSIFSCLIALLSAYFFLVEKEQVAKTITGFLSPSRRKQYRVLKQTTVDVLAGYIKAQFKIEIWIYLLLAVGLFVFGVSRGYLWALPIAILDLLPLFGTGTILIPWAIFQLLKGEYLMALGLVILWALSLLLRQIIQPKVLGETMGISAIPTLILLYLGYRLAGIWGIIFSVPLGLLVSTMNKAGFFKNCKLSLRILWRQFESCRRFTKEEEGSILGEEYEKEL